MVDVCPLFSKVKAFKQITSLLGVHVRYQIGYCYVFIFLKKPLNISSLIANKVKTNMFLISITLFIVRTILCATVETYSTCTYNNNYNANYSLVILICLQPFCKQIFLCAAHNLFVGTNIFSLDLYSGDLQTTTVHFTCNASSH